MQMKNHPDLLTLTDNIEKVSNELLRRFPRCHYTVQVLLWDDKTSKVEARHGDSENIHTVTWYNNQLFYESCPMLSNIATMDETGTRFFVLSPEERDARRLASVTEVL